MKHNKQYRKIYIITDIETTGLDYICDEVFDIAFIITDGHKIIDTYESLMYVNEHLLDKAIANIGHIINIDKELILQSRHPKDVYKECMHFLQKYIDNAYEYKLVAHNINVDYTMTLRSMERICIKLSEQYKNLFQDNLIDTIKVLKKLYPSLKKYALSSVVESLNIKDDNQLLDMRKENKHSAMLDCRILFLLLRHILKHMLFTSI